MEEKKKEVVCFKQPIMWWQPVILIAQILLENKGNTGKLKEEINITSYLVTNFLLELTFWCIWQSSFCPYVNKYNGNNSLCTNGYWAKSTHDPHSSSVLLFYVTYEEIEAKRLAQCCPASNPTRRQSRKSSLCPVSMLPCHVLGAIAQFNWTDERILS